MKKLLLTISISLSFVFFLSGQDVKVHLGPDFKTSKRSTLAGVIGADESGYYVLQTQAKGFRVQSLIAHFNTDLTMTQQKLLEPMYEKKDLDYEGMYYLNNKIYLFTSFKNKKTDKKFLFYQTVDKKTLTPNADLKKIAELDFKNNFNSGSFFLTTSKDSSKIMLVKNLPYEKDAAEKFEVKVFDNSMNQLWEEEVVLPYEEKLFAVSRYSLANNGDVYILGRLYDEKVKERRRGNVNYSYKILAYKDGKAVKEFNVSLADKFITDLQLAVSDKGELICSGFFSEKGTYSIAGTYFIKIDASSKQIISQHYKEFPKDFLTQYVTERQAKKIDKKVAKGKDVELYEFDLDELIIREDGGAYLIGEQYYVVVTTTTTTDANGNMSTRTTYHYHYHDIIVISFDEEGAIQWWEKIPKRQVSTNDGGFYSSYVRAIYDDELFFFFNDHIDNLDTWETGKFKNYTAGKNGIVTMVKLDKAGKQSRQMLYKTKDIESITVPKVCQQISKNEMIVYSQKKKVHQFSKVVFE